MARACLLRPFGQYQSTTSIITAADKATLARTLLVCLAALLALLPTRSADAADRIHWRSSREPSLVAAFSQTWQQQRGQAPELLDHSRDTLLAVLDYPTAAPLAAGGDPVVWLGVPRDAMPATGRQTGIYAEAGAAALFGFWQRLLPEQRPAGVLVAARQRDRWPIWRELAEQQRLPLRPGFVRPGELSQRVFALLRPRLGVLLYSAELSGNDPVALSVILRESLSGGLPVLGTDPSLLPAGALAVLAQTDAARGQQAARLALALLAGRSPGWQEPDTLQERINYQVARSLQLTLPTNATDSTDAAALGRSDEDATP